MASKCFHVGESPPIDQLKSCEGIPNFWQVTGEKNGLDNVQRGFFGSVLTTTIRWSIIVNNCCNTASFVNALNDWSRAFQLSWLSGQRGGWKKIHVTQPQGEDVMPDREKGLELKEKPVEKSIVENQFFILLGLLIDTFEVM